MVYQTLPKSLRLRPCGQLKMHRHLRELPSKLLAFSSPRNHGAMGTIGQSLDHRTLAGGMAGRLQDPFMLNNPKFPWDRKV